LNLFAIRIRDLPANWILCQIVCNQVTYNNIWNTHCKCRTVFSMNLGQFSSDSGETSSSIYDLTVLGNKLDSFSTSLPNQSVLWCVKRLFIFVITELTLLRYYFLWNIIVIWSIYLEMWCFSVLLYRHFL
jgi:hypothetical protein